MEHQSIYYLLSQCQEKLKEALSKLECFGKFWFYNQNLFSYIDIDNNCSYFAEEVLAPLGFTLPSLMYKRYSPKSHISLMTSHEQDFKIRKRDVYKAYRKWKKKKISFKIKCVDMIDVTEKRTGRTKILCILRVTSAEIEFIRSDLHLEPNLEFYDMHITLCEKYLE